MNSLVAIKEIKFTIYKFSEICKTNFMREFQEMFEENIHTSSAQFRQKMERKHFLIDFTKPLL